ncbi:MAG: preprotein translocase subunit SecG [Candidatus Zixiibacteriota bacterium]|nr:MAG: preprotein translocase subunit SecG [candidate division Zixibacteria bacterium]
MIAVLTMIHVIICIALIISVLMQSAKGEGLAGAFGGSGVTGAVFGGRGAATFLSKATTGLAIAFFVSCLILSFLSPGSGGVTSDSSGIQREAERRATEGTAPATGIPGTTPQEQPQAPAGQSEVPAEQPQTPPPTEGE